jgi:hypothetical protein
MTSRVNKRAAEHTADSSPLGKPSILRRIFSFVGRGEWVFLAASNLWATEYVATFSGEHLKAAQRTEARYTAYRALFESAARVFLAVDWGFDLHSKHMQFRAGRYADTSTLSATLEVKMPWRYVILGAACEGDVEKLKWLRSGSVELLAFLKEQGLAFPPRAWHQAVMLEHNQLQVVQFLHAEGVEWTAECCEEAAAAGNLEALRYMHEHGCPWETTAVRTAAAKSGSIEVMKYLQQEGLLSTVSKLTDMLSVAVEHNHLAAAKWLRQEGAAWPAILQMSGKLLTWATAEGCFSTVRSNIF